MASKKLQMFYTADRNEIRFTTNGKDYRFINGCFKGTAADRENLASSGYKIVDESGKSIKLEAKPKGNKDDSNSKTTG